MAKRILAICAYLTLTALCLIAPQERYLYAQSNWQIVFSTSLRGSSGDLIRISLDGTNPQYITNVMGDLQERSVVSADCLNSSSPIIFATSASRLYSIKFDGSSLQSIAVLGAFLTPVLSPNNQAFAFSGYLDGGNSNIYISPLGEFQPTLIAEMNDFGLSPAWSPDGTQIAFQNGSNGIDVVESNGSNRISLLNAAGNYAGVDWSPNGQLILFSANFGGQYNLYTFRLDNSELIQLTSDAGNNLAPRWSPDGSLISFSSTREGSNAQIYVMNADGSNVRRITPPEFNIAENFNQCWLVLDSVSPTLTPSPTLEPSATHTPTATPTLLPPPATATDAPSPTPTPTDTPTATLTPSVTPTATSNLTFMRGINLGSADVLTIDGNVWEGEDALGVDLSGYAFCAPSATLTPATDTARATMIRCSRANWANPQTLVTASGLSNAEYQVYLYVWEDNDAQNFTLSLNGQAVATHNSGSPGRWDKLGPFTVVVTNGSISVSTNGGDTNLSGVEIWRTNTVVPTNTPTPTLTPSPTLSGGETWTRIEAESYAAAAAGVYFGGTDDVGGGSAVYNFDTPRWLRFDNVDLRGGLVGFRMRGDSVGSGNITLRAGSPTGQVLCTLAWSPGGTYYTTRETACAASVTGVQTVWLVNDSVPWVNVNWLEVGTQ
jgi:hypothetical protein